jgi:rod shape determining protein RodA
MSYLEYNVKSVPTGFRKLLFLNWPIILLLCAISSAGFIMLYSVAGGSINPWLEPQLKRFALGMAVMLGIAMIPIWFWRNVSAVGYIVSVLLLIAVELFGEVRMGAQRWINLGFMVLQPSELAKITVVMFLASYYDWLPLNRKSHPLWVFIPVMIIMVPTALVLKQPDLGTALLVMIGGGTIMFLAGVHWAYFAAVIASGVGVVWAVMVSKGQSWQLL